MIARIGQNGQAPDRLIRGLSCVPAWTPVTVRNVHADGIMYVTVLQAIYQVAEAGRVLCIERAVPGEAWTEGPEFDEAKSTAGDILIALGVEIPADVDAPRWILARVIRPAAFRSQMFSGGRAYPVRQVAPDKWAVANVDLGTVDVISTQTAIRALRSVTDDDGNRMTADADLSRRAERLAEDYVL